MTTEAVTGVGVEATTMTSRNARQKLREFAPAEKEALPDQALRGLRVSIN
jgi:hypothetical protein